MIAAAHNGEPEEPDEECGGRGNCVDRDPHRIRGNIALIRRAIREDYPIDAETRASLVREMRNIMETNEDERARIGAAATIIAADNVNAKREAMDQKDEHAFLPRTLLHLHAEVRRTSPDELRAELEQINAALAEESNLGGGASAKLGEGEPA